MPLKKAVLIAALFTSAFAAKATSVDLLANNQWQAFGVDSFSSISGGNEWIDNANTNDPGYGTAIHFTFAITSGYQGTLTVVDADMAGDTFTVFNNGNKLGTTSSVPVQQYGSAPDVGYDFDAAIADSSFSRSVFSLGAGSYNISGVLAQSLMLGGSPLNATTGAIKLSVSAVPESSSASLVFAALGVLGLLARRNSAR